MTNRNSTTIDSTKVTNEIIDVVLQLCSTSRIENHRKGIAYWLVESLVDRLKGGQRSPDFIRRYLAFDPN